MKPVILADTGPLVALLDRRDRYHGWAVAELDQMTAPLASCEAVLTEACFLLRFESPAQQALLEMVSRGELALPFRLENDVDRVRNLMSRYANVPMSLADACLVRMAEVFERSRVLTLDGDFRIFRRNGRQVIPTLMPTDL